jgi:hypothetical protein
VVYTSTGAVLDAAMTPHAPSCRRVFRIDASYCDHFVVTRLQMLAVRTKWLVDTRLSSWRTSRSSRPHRPQAEVRCADLASRRARTAGQRARWRVAPARLPAGRRGFPPLNHVKSGERRQPRFMASTRPLVNTCRRNCSSRARLTSRSQLHGLAINDRRNTQRILSCFQWRANKRSLKANFNAHAGVIINGS